MSTMYQQHRKASMHSLTLACVILMTIGFAADMALPATLALAMMGL